MKKAKYDFFLNPYVDTKFSKCPRCNNKTKVRKHCLVIHYEDKKEDFMSLISINKTCKLCVECDLLITEKSLIEQYLQEIVNGAGINFNDKAYFVFGTVERKYWKRGEKDKDFTSQELFELVMPFKDSVIFEYRDK